MHLPESMKHMRYTEWNHTVKGLVEVWELARLLGLEESLESRLEGDDGTLAQQLGDMGHEFVQVTSMLRRSAVAMTLAHSAFLMDALNSPGSSDAADTRPPLAMAR